MATIRMPSPYINLRHHSMGPLIMQNHTYRPGLFGRGGLFGGPDTPEFAPTSTDLEDLMRAGVVDKDQVVEGPDLGRAKKFVNFLGRILTGLTGQEDQYRPLFRRQAWRVPPAQFPGGMSGQYGQMPPGGLDIGQFQGMQPRTAMPPGGGMDPRLFQPTDSMENY